MQSIYQFLLLVPFIVSHCDRYNTSTATRWIAPSLQFGSWVRLPHHCQHEWAVTMAFAVTDKHLCCRYAAPIFSTCQKPATTHFLSPNIARTRPLKPVAVTTSLQETSTWPYRLRCFIHDAPWQQVRFQYYSHDMLLTVITESAQASSLHHFRETARKPAWFARLDNCYLD